MKRFFTFLLIAVGVAPLLYSQITMTKVSHGFFSGNSHECQAVEYQSPGESGKNCVWDFSEAVFINDSKSVSNISDEYSESGAIKADRNDGCQFFFKTTENTNEFWGYQADNTTFLLKEPIVKVKYPQTFNTQFSGKFSGTMSFEGSDYSREIEGTYSTHADGIGTIILPGNESMTALRVKTTEDYGSFERVKYLWYAQNIRFPLFITFEDYSIYEDGTKRLSSYSSFLNVKAKNPGPTKSILTDFSYQVFPNPFRENIHLSYTLPEESLVTIELFASGGAKLTTLVSNQKQKGTQSISQDVSKFTQQPGIYLLKISVGDKTYSEKLVKSY